MTSSGWRLLVFLILVVSVGAWGFPRLESTPPVIDVSDEVVVGYQEQLLTIAVRDSNSGVRAFQVRLESASGSKSLLQQRYPGSLLTGGDGQTDEVLVEVALDPEALKLPDGRAKLTLTARDWSLRDGFKGNRTQQSVALLVDTQPPEISVESGLTYIYRGGSAAAVYRVSHDAIRDGVVIGDRYFPGFPYPGTPPDSPDGERRRIALFAIPVEAELDPLVHVRAEDSAGNLASEKFPARILERRFAESTISISDHFLESVAIPLARENALATEPSVDAFRNVNGDLRARNEAEIRAAIIDAVEEPLWEGAFTQLANSKVMSRFAELRTYTVDRQRVSQARHLGFDLASTGNASVSAANHGRVAFAGPLGIYGNCVIVDHGLGLRTLYAHLSRIDVEVGERVQRGESVGLTGATGLAAGDHLHFAILIADTYVDPMEWWDPRWVQSHITARLIP